MFKKHVETALQSGKTVRKTALNMNIQHHDVSLLTIIHQVYEKHSRLCTISPDGIFCDYHIQDN